VTTASDREREPASGAVSKQVDRLELLGARRGSVVSSLSVGSMPIAGGVQLMAERIGRTRDGGRRAGTGGAR
jgi:hypothetical protein